MSNVIVQVGPSEKMENGKALLHAALGGTMGDLIDATPKDKISRVMLEEKLFDSWYFDRTVLIGDGKSYHRALWESSGGCRC